MSSHQGRTDAAVNQLELWAEPGAPPMLGLRVLRRDGRESAFDLVALADSIRRAGWPGESLDGDTARSLARAVRLYLQQTPQPIAIDTVRETVERLLIEMGYTLSARMYAGAFAPSSAGEQFGAGAAGMFAEALPMDRAERFLAAAAADAGLARELADDVLAVVVRQIRVAGVQHLTPSLLREWMRSELHARALTQEAARLARLSLPVSALHDAFVENDRPPSVAPADPESAALALAQRVSGAYVLGQLLPSAAGQAHLRGDIQVRGIGNFLRLDSAQLDTRRLRVDVAELFVAQLAAQTDTLSRFFGGELAWPAINFVLAPLVADMPDAEMRELVHALLASTATFGRRSLTERATLLLGFAWDAPAGFAADAHEDRIPADAIYSAARRLFVTALELLAESTERTISTGLAIHVSPYFFGGPDADRVLNTLGRIAITMPVALHYDAPAPDLFAGFEQEPVDDVVAQTVVIPVARAARISADLDAFLARLEAAVAGAGAAHRAKHDFLQHVYAERGGPLTALKSGEGTMADPKRMLYRIAAKDAGVSALERAGAPWIEPGEALDVAEAALQHLRDACLREGAAANLRFILAEASSSRSLLRVLDRGPARFDTQIAKSLATECHPHLFYDAAPFFTVSGESFASAHEVAAFIRHAFLHSPCRALRIV